MCCEGLNATGLRWAAAVVWGGGDVSDDGDFDAEGLHSTYSGLTARAGATEADFGLAEAVAHGLAAGVLGDDLGGVGGAFAGAAKAHLAGAGPADHITGAVGDGDDRLLSNQQFSRGRPAPSQPHHRHPCLREIDTPLVKPYQSV